MRDRGKEKRNIIVPKMIFSGGQGTDENLSEARAMKQYALEHGVQESDIIIEDQSGEYLSEYVQF